MSRYPEFIAVISERVTNTRWTGRFDEHYRRIPLNRVFGGYMPGHVEAKDMHTSIGNRNRLMNRKTGKLVGRGQGLRDFGGTIVMLKWKP